jgi:hypothetical protein
MIAGIIMGTVMGVSQGAMIAAQKGVTGGQFALYMFAGAFIGGAIGGGAGIGGAALSTAIGIGGIIGGAVGGTISGTVTGATNGLAMGFLAGMKGQELGKAVGNGAWMGALTGFVGGAIMGGITAGIDGKNVLNGGPKLTLEEKFAIFVENNKAVLNSKFGESEIGGAYLANNENLAALKSEYGIDYRLKSGNLINSKGGKSNGFFVSGYEDMTTDGFKCYFNNDIYVSPNSVRSMLRGSNYGMGTLAHEWRHCYQLYTGEHDRMLSIVTNNHIEHQVHSMVHSIYPSRQGLYGLNYYNQLLGFPIIKW